MNRALALALLIFPGSLAASGQQSTPKIDSKALAILKEVGARYKALPAYADQGEIRMVLSIQDEKQVQTARKPFAFERPGKLKVEFGPVRFVTDGQTQVSIVENRCLVGGALKALTVEAIASNPATAHYFGSGVSGIPSMALFRLLTAGDPATEILGGVGELALDADRILDGVSYKVLRLVPFEGPTVRLLISPDRMVDRIEISPSPEELPAGITIEEISWKAGPIRTEPLPASTFQLPVENDLTRVESINELMGGPAPTAGPESPLLGKSAPAFEVKILDQTGAAKTVKSSEYLGKVLVLDFWASWCGPCLKELPEIARLIESYAKGPDSERLRVLAISLDAGESDQFDEIRKQVEQTLTEKQIQLRHGVVGQVGLDPANEVGTKFGVEAIPTLVVIDAKGLVRHIHVGFDPAIAETLRKEVDALLKAEP